MKRRRPAPVVLSSVVLVELFLLLLVQVQVQVQPLCSAFQSLSNNHHHHHHHHHHNAYTFILSSPKKSSLHYYWYPIASTHARRRPTGSNKNNYHSHVQPGSSSSTSTSLFATVTKPSESAPQSSSSNINKKSNNNNNNNSKGRKRYIIKNMFQQAKALERKGQWNSACQTLQDILEIDPKDAHSHLALARLQARREPKTAIAATTTTTTSSSTTTSLHNNNNNNNPSPAQRAFQKGTDLCPNSVHLWQAWAVYEENQRGNLEMARQLYEQALTLDAYNPYVCHAYGLMEKTKCQQPSKAQALWQRALEKTSTAALVCSLGELWIEQKEYQQARELYIYHLGQLQNNNNNNRNKNNNKRSSNKKNNNSSSKDLTEVYLALAWLEERYCQNYDKAHEWLQSALEQCPTSSLAHVALARLEGRRSAEGKQTPAVRRRLANAILQMEQEQQQQQEQNNNHNVNNNNHPHSNSNSNNNNKRRPQDGRIFNAWAHLEVQDRKFDKARKILARGIARYPDDQMLLQAAGKVEERVGNFTGARDLYSASLSIEPSAPTLVSYALLELRNPNMSSPTPSNNNTQDDHASAGTTTTTNYTYVKRLFEEALLLDPRHGPAYNAYGRAELRHGTVEEAKKIFERGVQANCADAASIYHGYAKMELSLGNVDAARELLLEGRRVAQLQDVGMDSQHRERALFLSHTLGMLELNSHRPSKAYEVFMDGIERYGNSSQLLLGAALCEVKLGKQDSARELFEKSVTIDNKHAQAWQAWGVMEMRAGNISTARKLFDCGIKSAPRHGALWQAYATLEGRLGEVEKARSLFVSGIKQAPRHVSLYQAWASLELREDNVVAAKRLLAKALTLDKRNGSGWLVAANIEKRLGNDGLVGLILRRGIECAPTEAELYRALGEHLVEKGEIENAREIYERGIEVNPLHAPIYHSLAELEARVFNVEGLAKLNRKAAEVFNSNALEPSPSSSQAWGTKIRARRSNDIPKGVAALAQKIVDEDGAHMFSLEEDLDPFAALDTMSNSLMEDELVGDLLQSNNVTDV